MYKDTIDIISSAAIKKMGLLQKDLFRYIVSSMLAGAYIGIGVLIAYSTGGILTEANVPYTKLIMGFCFSSALSLTMMAGGDLFTGSNMILAVGAYEKKVRPLDIPKLWTINFIGNFIGGIVLAILLTLSGSLAGAPAEYMVQSTEAKMNAPILQLFVRGILCNILVCLGVWSYYHLKEETAKLIMIFWCLFIFVAIGFEHSVANMTLFTLALLLPHPETVSLTGVLYNLVPVTLGNIVGGALFVGLPYWYISKAK